MTEIEKSNLIDQIDLVNSQVYGDKAAISDIKDKRLISILQTDASKVLDENGEPMLVYHGTDFGMFTVFDTDGHGKTRDTGAFFAERKKDAATYTTTSELFDSEDFKDYDINGKNRKYDSYTIAAPIEIAGEGFVGVAIVTRGHGTNANRFYLHEVVLQKNLLDESIKTDTEADSHRGDVANVLKEIVTAKGNGENVTEDTALRLREEDAREVAQRMDDNNGTEVVRFVDFLRRGRLEEGENRYFHVGETGDLLNEYGISGKITIGSSAINSHHSEDEDHLDENDWVEVIDKINEPVAITEYGDRGNSYRIYTIVEKNGKNICVGVDVNSVGRDVNITNIRTAFARDIANALNERLVYPHSRRELETAIRELSLRHNREVYPEQPFDEAKIGNHSETETPSSAETILLNLPSITPKFFSTYRRYWTI
ncbi:MAG: hypothetical protein II766_02860 [Paludibacteraceae bacterium]|nr:hypothetical protein [Paludibacteraceae bacterium]